MSGLVRACVALGSNLCSSQGDRGVHIEAGFAGVSRLGRLLARSSVLETEPVGVSAANAGGRYLNAAAVVETALSAREMLSALLAIERARGRDRSREGRWGPRTLDLDLLLFGDEVIDEPGLTVPHPRLHEREFVLGPLAEVAPWARVPTLGATVGELWRRWREARSAG